MSFRGFRSSPPRSGQRHAYAAIRHRRAAILVPPSSCGIVAVVQAPVAQLDRASVYGTEGCRFEPCRVYAKHGHPARFRLGRRGHSRGVPGRPDGRTSGRSWPPLSGGYRPPPAEPGGEGVERAQAGPCPARAASPVGGSRRSLGAMAQLGAPHRHACSHGSTATEAFAHRAAPQPARLPLGRDAPGR